MRLKYDENCLFLNVYVPTERMDEKLAVMIWLHGGLFVRGTSDGYVSNTLAVYGHVIVVTVNYRLGLFGFLSTGDKYAPGNYGLWDQHLAIKWVHDNIDDFGGDPGKVTIFGESAGSGSVVYQCLFEGSKGLFQRAIGQSGSITASWAFTADPKPDAEKLGKFVGCDQLESSHLVDCLRSVDAENLNSTYNNITNKFRNYPMSFIPSIDGEFVKETPKQMLQPTSAVAHSGHTFFSTVDFLAGITSEEGHLLVSPYTGVSDPENFQPNITEFETVLVPLALKLAFGPAVHELVENLTVAEYTDWSNPEHFASIRQKLVELHSDLVFTVPLIETIELHNTLAEPSKKSYQYVFDIMPSESVSLLKTPSWSKGANHADDLPFLFYEEADGMLSYFHAEDNNLTDLERDAAKTVITMWTNFARTGNPNKPNPIPVEWPEYTREAKQYLQITAKMTPESVKANLKPRQRKFWMRIIPSLLETLDFCKSKSLEDSKSSQGYCEKDGGCFP